MENIVLKNMALIRVISGLIEIAAALIFLKVGQVNIALRMNALLGLIGPLVFILVSVLGIAAIAVKLSWIKLSFICVGIILVLVGTKM